MHDVNTYLSATPSWLIALLTVAVGWLIARLTQVVSAKLLRHFRFNPFCERIGVTEALRKGDVQLSPCELVGHGLYWIILVAVLLEAARVLDIRVAVDLRQRVIAAIPALLSAVLLLAIGLILVAFASGVVRTLSRNAGSPFANLWARITRWIGTTLVLVLAVEQANVGSSVFVGVLYIFTAALALGLALAFGLGCKDMARNAMEKFIANLKEYHRDSAKNDMEG